MYVLEVLNVHWNEIHIKLTTIKWHKFKFKKVFKKITFSFSKVNFSQHEKKILLKKVDFLIIFFHMNVQNFRNIQMFISNIRFFNGSHFRGKNYRCDFYVSHVVYLS